MTRENIIATKRGADPVFLLTGKPESPDYITYAKAALATGVNSMLSLAIFSFAFIVLERYLANPKANSIGSISTGQSRSLLMHVEANSPPYKNPKPNTKVEVKRWWGLTDRHILRIL